MYMYILGVGGFSVDQLKGKQLSPMFHPDALVIYMYRAKMDFKTSTKCTHTV